LPFANAQSNSFVMKTKTCFLLGYIGSRDSPASVLTAMGWTTWGGGVPICTQGRIRE
jgi:hypothetical protein